MKINVFEGARRIALLTAALWGVGAIAVVWSQDPYIEMTFVVDSPDSAPTRIAYTNLQDQTCDAPNASEVEYRKTAKGTQVRARLCFLARETKDGRKLIPYKTDSSTKTWWGNDRNSSEVWSYKREVGQKFNLSKADEAWVDSRYWPERAEQIGVGLAWIVGGCVAIWIFAFMMGWIVRGFAGIPMGKDKRPE